MTYDKTKDYMGELKGDELFDGKNGKLVFLRGLERLARERGIKELRSKVVSASIEYAAVTSTYMFEDVPGSFTVYEGSADAHEANCSDGFFKYPVAMAESRSKARALRNAFGITACSVEEIGPEASPPCSDAQQSLLKHLMKEKKMDLASTVKLMKLEDVEALEQLTKDEASKLINKLQKVK